MMQLEVGGRRVPIAAGETVLGSGAGSGMPLEGEGVQPRHAIVQCLADGSAAIRRASADAEILVNGIRQGDDPTPLLHGDKIQIGPHEILVTDPARGGHTRFFDSAAFDRFVPPPKPGAFVAGPGGARLVCLTDGREYRIGPEGLVFGRDASSDVVVPGSDVSRRHARIGLADQAYVLADLSTNGTFVNGARIEGERALQRADVIRVGGDEFRFYVDAAPAPAAVEAAPPAEPAPAPAPAPSPSPEPPPAEDEARPPTGAQQRLGDTMHGLPGFGTPLPPLPGPVTPIAMAGAPIASLLVRSGTLKGKRLTVRVPVVTIGRAESNDLVVPEPSVSATHARLQRREGIWMLSDLGSTNGTYVDGERIDEETALGPGASIRFGEVTTLFESTDDITGIQPRIATRMIERVPEAAGAAPADAAPGAGRAEESMGTDPAAVFRRPLRTVPRPRSGVPIGAVIAVAIVVAAVVAYLLLTR